MTESHTDEQWEQDFAKLARQSGLQQPMQEVHDNLMQAFATHQSVNHAPSLLQRVIAALTFDSMPQMIPTGARATVSNTSRQLVFTTSEGDIALDVAEHANRITVNGQVFLELNEPAAVQLLQNEREIALAATDDIGEFEFIDIEPGAYDLILATTNGELLLENVPLSIA